MLSRRTAEDDNVPAMDDSAAENARAACFTSTPDGVSAPAIALAVDLASAPAGVRLAANVFR